MLPSRILKCKLCNTENQIGHTKLWGNGCFNRIHCKGCKTQTRSLQWKCTCNLDWHDCEVHMHDHPADYKPIKNSGTPAKVQNGTNLHGIDTTVPSIWCLYHQMLEILETLPWNTRCICMKIEYGLNQSHVLFLAK